MNVAENIYFTTCKVNYLLNSMTKTSSVKLCSLPHGGCFVFNHVIASVAPESENEIVIFLLFVVFAGLILVFIQH